MIVALSLSLILVVQLYAENATSTSCSPPTAITYSSLPSEFITDEFLFDVGEELENIKSVCFTKKDIEELFGNTVKFKFIEDIARYAIRAGMQTIGLTELRSILNFGPVRPWTNYNRDTPSDKELGATKTLEEFYNVLEPRNKERSLSSKHLVQSSLPSVVAYLDKRFPAIRTLFKLRFQKARQSLPENRNKAAIEKMVGEYSEVEDELDGAFSEVDDKIDYDDNRECVRLTYFLARYY